MCILLKIFFLFFAVCVYLLFPGSPNGKKKNLPAGMQKTWVESLGWEDPLEKGMAHTPVFLPGEFHGQRYLGG